MAEDTDFLVKSALSAIVVLGSGLTSIGTAGISGIAGIGALFAIWGIDWN